MSSSLGKMHPTVNFFSQKISLLTHDIGIKARIIIFSLNRIQEEIVQTTINSALL